MNIVISDRWTPEHTDVTNKPLSEDYAKPKGSFMDNLKRKHLSDEGDRQRRRAMWRNSRVDDHDILMPPALEL